MVVESTWVGKGRQVDLFKLSVLKCRPLPNWFLFTCVFSLSSRYDQTRDLLENRKLSLLKILAVTSSSPAPGQKSKAKSKKSKVKTDINILDG